ncbi:ABC transporter ATP-binding protein [Dactylosporangium sp. NPDC051484]|uniref:ABC transporter ATP-binding protein n=1 Tax=Dactylosporangium sp. NPDC051484 TaxID=3154942 RepID=UPI003450300E
MTTTVQGSRADTHAIKLSGVKRSYPTAKGEFVAVKDVNLTVASGEFVSVVGPSGCGKSTLLGLLAGLAKPAAGTVETLGHPVRGVNTEVGFIFQRDALLPWRTAEQNVALPLRYHGMSKRDALREARAWLARVKLDGFGERYPHQLSGGMRKRVAIAASLAYQPKIILMDEPFSALDVQTRTIMEDDLLVLWQEYRPSVIFITHDLEEAVGLSDRVLVMSASPGTIVGEFTIDLPRPRNLLELRYDERFNEISHEIWERLRKEVLRTNGDKR